MPAVAPGEGPRGTVPQAGRIHSSWKNILDKVVQIFLFAYNLKKKTAVRSSLGTLVSLEGSGGLEDLGGTDSSGKKCKISRTEDPAERGADPGQGASESCRS